MNIYEKLNAIMAEVKSLKKDGEVAFGNTRYNYLSEAKTTEIVREQFIKHKLVLLPIKVEESKEGQVTHGVYTYKLVNAENPEEYIELMSGGQGHDSADKGSGKASSYAYKYLMWRALAIPSNDDPDQISSAEIDAEKKKKEKREAATQDDTEKVKANTIDKTKVQVINDMIDKTKTDIVKFCTHFKINAVYELTNEQFVVAMKMLEKK